MRHHQDNIISSARALLESELTVDDFNNTSLDRAKMITVSPQIEDVTYTVRFAIVKIIDPVGHRIDVVDIIEG